jgi:hypothetical protein
VNSRRPSDLRVDLLGAVALAAALAGCTPTTAGPSPARPAHDPAFGAAPSGAVASAAALPAEAPVTVVPMKLVLKITDPPKVLAELHADGAVVDARGTKLGSIQGARALDATGKPIAVVRADGSLRLAENEDEKVMFNDDGDLVDDKGVVHFSKDGTMVMTEAGGSPARLPIRFDGFSPAANRAAALMLLVVGKGLTTVDVGL